MHTSLEKAKRAISEIAEYFRPEKMPIPFFEYKRGYYKDPAQAEADVQSWQRLNAGETWGGHDEYYWFRANVVIPQCMDGKPVMFEIRTGKEGYWDATNPQFLMFLNGTSIHGLDVNHTAVLLTMSGKAGENYRIDLQGYTGTDGGKLELETCLSLFEKQTEDLYYDMLVANEICEMMDKDDKRRIDILARLDHAVNMLDFRKPYSPDFYRSIDEAREYLRDEMYAKLQAEDILCACVGSTHIDVAWLWTLAQTRNKVARSFSTVLWLMQQYPEYQFMISQPQLYQFLKEDYPDIYERVKARIQEGRWEAEGGMWLEADCNVSSGESLVRQFLFGTRFYQKEFGVKNEVLWLPDVFGYSAALPQILKRCGIKYFMTTKISWNDTNRLPYDTFQWRGIDGTEVLTHFVTTRDRNLPAHIGCTTYNGHILPVHLLGAWEHYQNKDINNELLVSFGLGDGGGGPTREMLERYKRLEKGLPGCPRAKMTTVAEYFHGLEKRVADKKLSTWVGELYLEYHRGTYTSMARNKKYNRKSEFLYEDTELFNILNGALTGAVYPQQELNQGWETILLNQFHDILPGSSIRQVYEDSQQQYIQVQASGKRLLDNALRGIAGGIATGGTSVVVFNPSSFSRTDLACCQLPEGWTDARVTADGVALPAQTTDNGLVFMADVPAKGYRTFRLEESTAPAASELTVSKSGLSNRFFELHLNEQCEIVSLWDKRANRELIAAGQRANVLQAFEDKPLSYDAWDINLYYQDKMWETDFISAEVVENGPVRAVLRVQRKFMDSTITQDIMLYADIDRIDFVNTIDWKESHILLKAAFPVDIHAEKATYEIQYGNVERPTHWNTSWDHARFEVCAHKWADLSEDGYGVSLMNDCKFGHDIKDNVLRLTLLKSATSPNVDADRELHTFTYSLYPHSGSWRDAHTVQKAYALNTPFYTQLEQAHAGNLPETLSFVSVDQEYAIIEVLKKAEDSDDLIVRLYECYNRRGPVTLTFFRPLAQVWECDMLENNQNELAPTGNQFTFELKPYEIRTFKLRLK